MENNLAQSIHIEFYGLPGSGKSTISHMVAEQLKKDGYKVIEPTYDIAHRKLLIIRKLTKIVKSILFSLLYSKDFKDIYNLVKENKYKGLAILRQILNIAPKIMIYKNTKENCIYIWDEGIVQSAISLSIINDINPERNYEAFYEIINNDVTIKRIYLYVSKKIAKERMNFRPTNDSRVEKANKHDSEIILDKIFRLVKLIEIKEGIKENSEKSELNSINNIINYIYSFIIKGEP